MKINLGFFIIEIKISDNKFINNFKLSINVSILILGIISILKIIPYLEQSLSFIIKSYNECNFSPESNIIISWIGLIIVCYSINTILNIINSMLKLLNKK